MNATFQIASAQTTFYLYFTLRRLNGHPNSFGAPSRAYDQLRVCHTYLHTEMRAAQYKQTQVFFVSFAGSLLFQAATEN